MNFLLQHAGLLAVIVLGIALGVVLGVVMLAPVLVYFKRYSIIMV